MTTAVWLAGVALAGLVVRAIPVALADFPVNDGGLFVAMTRAIEDAGWSLPLTISWNGSELPFAYPPLGFYLSGGISSLFGLELTDVFRWLPLVASALVVPAVFLLARELLRSDLGALVAALAYALAPASYVWLVQGGGVTRSPGMLLAVLTIWQVVRLVRVPGRRTAIVVGVLAGLTALVHPGAAIFAAVSSVLIWLFEGRTAASVRRAAGLGGDRLARRGAVARDHHQPSWARRAPGRAEQRPRTGRRPAGRPGRPGDRHRVLRSAGHRRRGGGHRVARQAPVPAAHLVRRGDAALLSVRDGPVRAAHRFRGGVPRRPADYGDRSRGPEGSAGQPWDPGRCPRVGGRRIGPGRAESRCAPARAHRRAAGGHGVGGCQPGTGGRAGGDHEQRVVRRPRLRVVLSPRRAPLGGHRPGLGMAGRGCLRRAGHGQPGAPGLRRSGIGQLRRGLAGRSGARTTCTCPRARFGGRADRRTAAPISAPAPTAAEAFEPVYDGPGATILAWTAP